MRSGWSAARVLGVTSAKINIMRVKVAVAQAMPLSPINRSAIIVAMDEARILTKLLPINMTPISRSGRRSNASILLACLLPLCAKYLNRYRFNDIIPVSELEKKPERKIRKKRVIPRAVKDTSFN